MSFVMLALKRVFIKINDLDKESIGFVLRADHYITGTKRNEKLLIFWEVAVNNVVRPILMF